MAMTFGELQKAFELHINAEGEIDGAQLKVWFKEAQLDLAQAYRQEYQAFTGTDPEQVCGLHPALHDLIPLFAAARYWDRESEGDYEESSLGTKWMNYYRLGKEERKKQVEGIFPKLDHWQVI
ncbi:MAG: hypothetical protein RR051_01660 [Clostridiales bacterium]